MCPIRGWLTTLVGICPVFGQLVRGRIIIRLSSIYVITFFDVYLPVIRVRDSGSLKGVPFAPNLGIVLAVRVFNSIGRRAQRCDRRELIQAILVGQVVHGTLVHEVAVQRARRSLFAS